MKFEKFTTHDVKETQNYGFSFAKRLKAGDIVSIEGPLGSGKTEFIKGISEYFAVEEIVSSPTFTFINQYLGKKNDEEIIIYHIDLYRIKSIEELEEIGFIDCVNSESSIKLIEWPEKANGLLHDYTWQVKIEPSPDNEDIRIITIHQNASALIQS